MERIHPDTYRLPVLDVAEAVTLATALLSAIPEPASEQVKEAAEEVRETLAALEQLRHDRRVHTPSTSDVRPIDNLVDRSWSALHSCLDGIASLPRDLYPRAGEAATLRDAIFPPPRPLAFLRLRYLAQWAEVKAHLDFIEQQKLAPRLDALVGTEFLAEIRRTFELYGAALGITQPQSPKIPSPGSLLESLRNLNASLNSYTIAVLAMARRNKPETHALVATALEAIPRTRRAISQTSALSGPEPGGEKGQD